MPPFRSRIQLTSFERACVQDLCGNMDDYARVENDGRTGFTKISNTDGEAITISGGLSLGGDQSKDAKRELKLFCDALVEEHEDSIGKLLQDAQVGTCNRRAAQHSELLALNPGEHHANASSSLVRVWLRRV